MAYFDFETFSLTDESPLTDFYVPDTSDYTLVEDERLYTDYEYDDASSESLSDSDTYDDDTFSEYKNTDPYSGVKPSGGVIISDSSVIGSADVYLDSGRGIKLTSDNSLSDSITHYSSDYYYTFSESDNSNPSDSSDTNLVYVLFLLFIVFIYLRSRRNERRRDKL